ncbi:IS3 family transposase [Nakamurella panacisegetis]|uniref:IS3 family transposase n=1 Tax=Nakamurella panacisegetis TaxID=1090615 RepID=UPI000B846119
MHTRFRGVYGARRIHAELTLGQQIKVGHGSVEYLMRAAGIKRLPGNKRPKQVHQTPTAADLVDRKFARTEPNKLWVTDITEHPTREGKIYCAVVLDVFSRRPHRRPPGQRLHPTRWPAHICLRVGCCDDRLNPPSFGP